MPPPDRETESIADWMAARSSFRPSPWAPNSRTFRRDPAPCVRKPCDPPSNIGRGISARARLEMPAEVVQRIKFRRFTCITDASYSYDLADFRLAASSYHDFGGQSCGITTGLLQAIGLPRRRYSCRCPFTTSVQNDNSGRLPLSGIATFSKNRRMRLYRCL